jgi:asparagine synthase (glutamine-hydrolysing)
MTAPELALREPDRLGRLGAGSWIARLDPSRNGGGLELRPGREPSPPASASDGTCVVVFAGHLDNAAELQGIVGQSEVDSFSELVLAGYRRLGHRVLDRLRGVFALIVWDGESGTGFCARDPVGHHPLFYASRGSVLYLSDSINALLTLEEVSTEVNRAALADHLCFRWPDPGETYFEDVRRVPASHELRVGNGGGLAVERYWDPVPPGEDERWIGDDEIDRFDDLFSQAVDRCLARGRPGIFLSGGMDSVTVAAEVTHSTRVRGLAPPQALSMVYSDPSCNEESVQQGVARALGLEQVMLDFEEALPEGGLLASATALSRQRPAPLYSFWAPGYLRLAREGRSRGCEVILTGHGGDEWLGVGPIYAADLLRSLDLAGFARLFGSYRRSYPVRPAKLLYRLLWKWGARPLLADAAWKLLATRMPRLGAARRRRILSRGIHDWVAPDAALRDELLQRGEKWWPERSNGSHYLHATRIALDNPLISIAMEETFENGRELDMAVLAPFSDTDLVDFLYRTPPRLLDKGGRAKGLVRDRLARKFPELGFERQRKINATSYVGSMIARELTSTWGQMGGITRLAELGIADPQRAEPTLAAALAGDRLAQHHAWQMLNVESWLRSNT